ncbi:MAG: hypothetical protein P0Y55_18170 [Candidatus Cohnella colombiensis]|uniref:Uncharacterized protein n=1 Tax=Candidatus Cohnella colombiensis TaxID=3121368 RepID=A0AA95EWK2_9BACL|nr:MAG: hypothetical protein P0Y55_18170 [Cohnella sp.]
MTKWKIAIPIIILIGAGLLILSQAERESAFSESTASKDKDDQLTLAVTEDERFRLYVTPSLEDNNGFSQVYVESDAGKVQTFNWPIFHQSPALEPTLELVDLNNDGVDELVVILRYPLEYGTHSQVAHVLNTTNLTEIPVQDAGEYLTQNTKSQIAKYDDHVLVKLNSNGQSYEKAFDSKQMAAWGDTIDFNYSMNYKVVTCPLENRLCVTVDAVIGVGADKLKFGTIDVYYALTEQGMVVDTDRLGFLALESEIAGEIPLYAIQAGGNYIALWDRDSADNLVALLGEPIAESTRQLGPEADTFDGTYIRELTYDGLELKLASGDGEGFYIIGIRVFNDRYKTSLGIKVGDTTQQVEAIYPSIEVAKEGREPPDNFAYILSESIAIGLLIDIKDGIVNEMYFEYLMD